MTDLRAEAIALYDRFTHEGFDRRAFMSELTRLAGSTAAAGVLLASISADPAAAAVTQEADPTLIIRRVSPELRGHKMKSYVAMPRAAGGKRLGTVVVIHENRGLNRHIEDVTRRIALEGYIAVAPDFLSVVGGTPVDEDKAREAIGKLDLADTVADAVAGLERARSHARSNGKVGAVGFCWGGAFVNRLAVAAGNRLDAGVAYYGPAPDPSEATKVKAAMLLHFAGLDERVNATGLPWAEALKKAGAEVEAYTYSGVNHAFNNDTSSERYDKGAADLAWQRTVALLKRKLA